MSFATKRWRVSFLLTIKRCCSWQVNDVYHHLFLEGHLLRGRWHGLLSRCLDQLLAVMAFIQHRVSWFKTVRQWIPEGARCVGHVMTIWSAVCSAAPHSQYNVRAIPQLCMDDWKHQTPVLFHSIAIFAISAMLCNSMQKVMCPYCSLSQSSLGLVWLIFF